jgi:hypothetical protein
MSAVKKPTGFRASVTCDFVKDQRAENGGYKLVVI